MIILSMVFVVLAVALLAVGLVRGEEAYYYLSIVASAVAGLALVTGVRLAAAAKSVDDDFDARPSEPRGPTPAIGRVPAPRQRPAGQRNWAPREGGAGVEGGGGVDGVEPEPPDEPPVQVMTPLESTGWAS